MTAPADCAFCCVMPSRPSDCPIHGGRPADPGYTPDPATVELVARAIVATGCHCSSTSWVDALDDARAALDALHRARRLAPPDADTREQWGVRLTWNDGRAEDFERDNRADAEAMHNHHVRSRRENPDWLVTSALIRREVVTWVGPWLPVPITGETP